MAFFMKHDILSLVEDAIKAIEFLKKNESLSFLNKISMEILNCYDNGGKILIAGNGGSMCDSMHFAEELTGFFRKRRRPLAAIALADPAHISCVANDVGFEYVFSRMVEAIGSKNDLFITLTTSGNSKNLIEGSVSAKKKGLKVIGFLGKDGGALKEFCDIYWIVEGFLHSDRIQEAHMTAIHIIIEMVEKKLFPDIIL